MPNLEDASEGDYALGRRPGRFYVSRRFPQGGPNADVPNPLPCRFAYQVVDNEGEVVFESEDGWEVVLRETPTRQQLRALFFEDDRQVQYLTFQRFNAKGDQLNQESFHLSAAETKVLRTFLSLIESDALELAEGPEGVRLLPGGVEAIIADDTSRGQIFRRYRSAFRDLIEADVESPEIVAFARRRRELQTFDALLGDAEFFKKRRLELKSQGHRSGPEDVWQDFFEVNQWIFGTGLATQFLHAWNADRLEETVSGSSVFGPGKRPDALMRTAGAMSALVFVEIKQHETPLLDSEYRSGAWVPGKHVVGGVAQCHATVDEVVRRARQLDVLDDNGFETGVWALICRPRSLLVVGSLEQFLRGGKPNLSMFEGFERYRRSLTDPEIITFDELYERARLSLELAAQPRGIDTTPEPTSSRSAGIRGREQTWDRSGLG
jgi:hypothetical protein